MIEYRATIDITDRNGVRFFEQYTVAFETHAQTAHFQAFETALPDRRAGEPQISHFEAESAPELELVELSLPNGEMVRAGRSQCRTPPVHRGKRAVRVRLAQMGDEYLHSYSVTG